MTTGFAAKLISIEAVDGKDTTKEALLHYLQLEILGGDEPQDSSTGHWWVAYDKALPVGFASMVSSTRWGDTGYLSRSGVLPAYRGQGIQKRLLRARERKARAIGWRWLISDTFQNPPSSNNLISCGFRIFTPNEPWGFDGAIYWKKELF
jgi:GNAT superfamily N-acetyltransferase